MPIIPAVYLMPGDEVVVSPEGEVRRVVAVDKTERYAPTSKVRVDFHDDSSVSYDSSRRLSVRPR